jgi:hypothetical protein
LKQLMAAMPVLPGKGDHVFIAAKVKEQGTDAAFISRPWGAHYLC